MKKATALRFPIEDIRMLMAHSEAAPSQRPAFSDYFDPAHWKPGAKPNSRGYVAEDMVDTSKIAPSLLLVHDDGVYIMSNGKPMLPDPFRPGRSVVTYALGLGSDADPSQVLAAVGGDDFSERIATASIREVIGTSKSAKYFVIRLREDTMEFTAE